MADSYIQVAPDSTGKKLQTYRNTVSGNDVDSEAVTLTDSSGAEITTLPVDATGSTVAAVISDGGGSITVDGTVAVSGSVTVTGPLTDTQLRATPVPISGTVAATGPLTDTQLRATPVPISGTVTASGPLTDTELRASAVPISAATLPLPSLAATSTKQSDGTQKSQIVDGSGNVIAATSNALNVNVQNATITATGTVATTELPDATSTYAPSNATSTAYEASRVIKGSAGVLFAITGYNSSASDQFIQLHDSASLPADTAVPVVMFLVRASRNFSLSFGGKFGRFFSTGIVICNSSTGSTKTIGSADCWFDAQYK